MSPTAVGVVGLERRAAAAAALDKLAWEARFARKACAAAVDAAALGGVFGGFVSVSQGTDLYQGSSKK